MKFAGKIVTPLIKWILCSFCRVDYSEFIKVPEKGPLIIVVNHINFLEVPILYSFLYPRRTHGIIKRETWNNFLLGKLADTWEALSLDRNNPDINVMRKVKELLKKGRIIIIAPEGTRSGSGSLSEGRSGIVTIAFHNNAPILPIAHYGGEKVWGNLKSVRRTRVKLKVGKPFYISPGEKGITKKKRQDVANEIMFKISELLPVKYRGVYSDLSLASENYITFLESR